MDPPAKIGSESKIGEVHSISPSPLYWVENFQSKILKSRFPQSGGGEDWGIPPLTKKLACLPMFSTILPPNVDFVILMPFLAILPNIPPTLVETKWEKSSCHRYLPRVAYYVPCQKRCL